MCSGSRVFNLHRLFVTSHCTNDFLTTSFIWLASAKYSKNPNQIDTFISTSPNYAHQWTYNVRNPISLHAIHVHGFIRIANYSIAIAQTNELLANVPLPITVAVSSIFIFQMTLVWLLSQLKSFFFIDSSFKGIANVQINL